MLFAGLLLFILIIFIQPQEFLPAMMGMRIVAIVIGAVSVGWVFNGLAKRNFRLFESPQNRFMFLLWTIIVISTLSVHWITYTFGVLIEWGKVVLIFILIMNIVDSENKLKKVFLTIALGALVIAVMGIFQYYGEDITSLGTHFEGRIRGIGIFDTNQLAYTVAFCIPFVFCLLLISRNLLRAVPSGILLSVRYRGNEDTMPVHPSRIKKAVSSEL